MLALLVSTQTNRNDRLHVPSLEGHAPIATSTPKTLARVSAFMTEDAGPTTASCVEEKSADLVRDAQGVRRVVRVHDDGEASVLHEALEESQER